MVLEVRAFGASELFLLQFTWVFTSKIKCHLFCAMKSLAGVGFGVFQLLKDNNIFLFLQTNLKEALSDHACPIENGVVYL